jgi:hypothetical protein
VGFGGGISNGDNAYPILTNCIIRGNLAEYGGGISNDLLASPTLTNCTISENTATNDGGGIHNINNSSPTLINDTISGNTALHGGGIYNEDHSNPIIFNNIISGNTAPDGGGIYSTNYCAPELTNVLIAGNSATHGGGIFTIDNCASIFINVTIAGNKAIDGGGIYNYSSAAATYTNTIVWGNSSGLFVSGTTPSFNYSLVQGATLTGTANLSGTTDPQFVSPLAYASAPITGGDYTLRRCSPALNAGDNTANSELVDLAGNNRKFGVIDLGAYECQQVPNSSTIIAGVSRRYVKPGCAGDGSSWADASNDLQAVINASTDGDEIWVAAGIYKPTHSASGWTSASPTGVNANPADRDNAFILRQGVKIYGGFPAIGNPVVADRNWTTNVTTLSGDLDNSGNISTGDAYHVVIGVSANLYTILDGFTITGGNANSTSAISVGGQNVARNFGGGISNPYSASATFANLIISGNASVSTGGGMYNANSSAPTLTNVTITANTANYGGGIANVSATPVITNSTITLNTAANNGGGVYNNGASPVITNSTISGNSANSASSYGGGIYNIDSSPLLTNVTISGNFAWRGGGINNNNSSPTLTNVTIAGNKATGNGGGIFYEIPTSSYTLINTIIWGNSSGVYGGSYNSTYSLMQGEFGSGIGDLDGTLAANDPLFVNWIDPTAGSWTATTAGNYNLQACSPCVNKGNNAANGETYDLAGNPRIYGGTIDMGAYENQSPAPPIVTAASRRYVKPTCSGTGDASSWINASGDLQAVINASAAGDTIWVAEGTYIPTHTALNWTPASPTGVNANPADRDNAFVLKEGVKIYGGFTGTTETLLAQRNWTTNVTILSGDIDNSPTDITGNARHVVIGAGNITAATVLDGFTITGGNADGNNSITVNGHYLLRSDGGGIFNYNSSPTLTNLTINENIAEIAGGGIVNRNYSSPTLTNITISGNIAINGGGISNWDNSSPMLANVTIS